MPGVGMHTFIFPYILERKREARVFPLDDAHLAECAFAHDAQQAEVVEVHCLAVSVSELVSVDCVGGAR